MQCLHRLREGPLAALLAALLLLFTLPASAGTATLAPKTLGADVSDAVVRWFIYPDIQYFTTQELTNPLGAGNSDGERVAAWVCSEAATYGIRGVISMGDMLVDGSAAPEWAIVSRVIAAFEACGMPFAPLFGNHEAVAVQRAGIATDASLFHTNVGRAVLTARAWWKGEWPSWTELTLSGSPLYLEASSVGARSYRVSFPPLEFVMTEWEMGARLVDGRWSGPASKAEQWAKGVPSRRPGQPLVVVSHAGPCDSIGCDLTPQDATIGPAIFGAANTQMGVSGRGYGWREFTRDMGPQAIGFLGGHWNRGFEGCQTGAGAFATHVRDDLSRFLTAQFDFNCSGRTDPVAGALCDDFSDCSSNPYTWQGWIELDRQGRQLCAQSVRTIDVDADDDGEDEAVAATLRIPPDVDRGSAPWSDPDVTNPESYCNDALRARYSSGPATACPNNPRTCVALPAFID